MKTTLEDKHYKAVDIIFPLISALINRATGYSENTKLKCFSSATSDSANHLILNPCSETLSSVSTYNLKKGHHLTESSCK